MTQQEIIENFHNLVTETIHKFMRDFNHYPTHLFLGMKYQVALETITGARPTTYCGLTLYPIDTDILLVAIVASPTDLSAVASA